MSLSEISIKKPVFAWMLMAGLIVFGSISFLRMGISQLPDVDFPVISIRVTLEGAAPEVMEADVVDVVENAVMSVQGIRNVTSSAKYGQATITVELDLERDIDLALQDVQAKVAEAQRKLPDKIDPPVITKTNPEDQPIMWVTVESDRHSRRELMLYVRDHIQDKFLTAPDVGDINMGGYVDPNLRVWVSPRALAKYQLTVSDVISTIQNEHSELPGGTIASGPREFNVRTMGEAMSVEDFKNLRINTRGGGPNFIPIRLGNVAKIEAGLADIRRISRTMGNPAVGLGIRKQRGSNAVAVAEGVKEKIKALEPKLPQGMKLGLVFDSTQFIKEAVNELVFTLVLSAILTALVCWAFLGSWSSTFNVLMSIPTSIVGTFIILNFAGFTLNTFTLLALSLAIGIVVDDAIMVLENVMRHREMGKNRVKAALDGSTEIAFAALAATISIVAIFLPVAFMKGVIGKFFFQFGVTMSAAVLLSLVEALTLTPMRCAEFVDMAKRRTRIGRAMETFFERALEWYRKLLARSLEHRLTVLGASMLVFVLSIVVAKFLNKEFAPSEDQSRFMIRLKTPVGSSIDFMDEKTRLVEKFLMARSEVLRYFVAVGGGGSGGDVNTAMVFVTLKPPGERGKDPKSKRELSQSKFMQLCRTNLKVDGLEVRIQDLSMRGFSASRGYPVEFSVQGPDWDTLAHHAKELMDRLTKTGLVADADYDYDLGMPELQVRPDRVKAAARGVSVATIGQTVNSLIGGVVIGQYSEGGHRYDIRLKLEEDGVSKEEKIARLLVRNNRGELVPLSDVVSIRQHPTLQAISRNNRQRAVTVFANIAPGKSQQDALAAVERISKEVLPEQYHIVMTGSSESFRETFGSLIFALVLGLVVAYMVLASQFNSFIDPVTVLLALPFSLSGAFLGLWVTGNSLNIYSMIGLILLMGIVKKNSILLVDFTNLVRERDHLDTTEALIKACPMRLRPILMTSFATIVGALPAALALGPGSESRIPMATAVIGGVTLSTVLTLFVVPSAYSLFSRFRRTVPLDATLSNLSA